MHPFELEARLGGEHTYDIDKGALFIRPFPATSAKCAWAWEQRALCIIDQPLAAAVAEVNRYIPHPIHVTDPSLASLTVGGWFEIDSLIPSFPNALEKTFGLRIIVREDEILLFPKS
jgi:ferric-dicitrate binding protein FerR (iron transport regulator)